MTSADLRTDQAHELGRIIAGQLAYLGKLRRRMELLGFPPADPLYQATSQAHDAMQELHVRIHYCGCRHGVGR